MASVKPRWKLGRLTMGSGMENENEKVGKVQSDRRAPPSVARAVFEPAAHGLM
jgi:hypothetical protein